MMVIELAVAIAALSASGSSISRELKAGPSVAVVDLKYISENSRRYAAHFSELNDRLKWLADYRRQVERDIASMRSWKYAAQDLWLTDNWAIENWVAAVEDRYFSLSALVRGRVNWLYMMHYDLMIEEANEVCRSLQAAYPGMRIIYSNLALPVFGAGCVLFLRRQVPPNAVDVSRLVVQRIDER